MKILIVSDCPSHPTTAGNRRFILDQVELFIKMGHEMYFLYIDRRVLRKQQEKGKIIISLKNYWGDKLFLYHQSLLQKLWSMFLIRYRKCFCNGYHKCDDSYPFHLHNFIERLDAQYHFDACLVNYFYLSKAFRYITIPRKGLVTHDCFAYKGLLVSNRFVENNLMANEEAKAMQRSPHIFALNEGEAEYFQRLSPLSKVYCIYGSFIHHISPVIGNHNILFLSGPNGYNVNGLKWFLDHVFDSIVDRFPDVILCIGGAICNVVKNWNFNSNIKLFGYVGSADEFYSMGDVAINPTYQGTGLKIKTFEAIAYDKVLLTHPHSKIGIFKKDEAPIFASNIPKDWVSFLDEIWSGQNRIEMIKTKNKQYLEQMNTYIKHEYNRFLYDD